MNVVRHATPQAFLDRAEPFLLRDEPSHNLLLGIPARLAARGDDVPWDVYLATVEAGGDIVAAAMMTPPWRLVLSHTGDLEAVPRIAQDVHAAGLAPPGVHAPVEVCDAFTAAWTRLTGARAQRVTRERIHRLDRVRPVPSVPGRLQTATESDRALLLEWLVAFAEEAFSGDDRPPAEARDVVDTRLGSAREGLVLWIDGAPRCLAGYGSPTRHGIRIGPVYTPPEHRGRGYGTACVADLSRRLLEPGGNSPRRQFCMLYTDLANPTSNRIYRRIGYEPVCDVAEDRFTAP